MKPTICLAQGLAAAVLLSLISLGQTIGADQPAAPEPIDAPDPDLTEKEFLRELAHNATVAGTRAGIASSDARTAISETRARINAGAVSESRIDAKAAAFDTKASAWTVKGAMGEAANQAAGASAAMAAAQQSLSSAEALVGGVEDQAAGLASADISGRLAPLYKSFEAWRVLVLRPPAREQRIAGMRAAQPYEKALQNVESKIVDQQRTAQILTKQARGLRSSARGLAAVAAGKQSSGDVAGADLDMNRAQTMMGKANSNEGQVVKINGDITNLQASLSPFVVAAQAARRQAEARYTGLVR